jgi:hypothetical protein
MSNEQHFELLIIGSGDAGKNLAWKMRSRGALRFLAIDVRSPAWSCLWMTVLRKCRPSTTEARNA